MAKPRLLTKNKYYSAVQWPSTQNRILVVFLNPQSTPMSYQSSNHRFDANLSLISVRYATKSFKIDEIHNKIMHRQISDYYRISLINIISKEKLATCSHTRDKTVNQQKKNKLLNIYILDEYVEHRNRFILQNTTKDA